MALQIILSLCLPSNATARCALARNRKELVLTPQGKALQESLSSFSEEMQKQITQDIDLEDLDTFVKVAEIMTKNLTDQ